MEVHKLVAVQPKAKIDNFSPGDTVRVSTRIKEGDRERIQAFEGVVIATRKAGPATSFTVRRVTFGVGVERSFPLYSPLLEKVEVIRRGAVRRGKLYYLRSRFGKAARIKERSRLLERAEETTTQPAPAEGAAPAPAAQEPSPTEAPPSSGQAQQQQ